MKQALKRSDPILDKLKPYICLAEWGRADIETILHDAMLCKENGIPAISVLPIALSAARSAAPDIKIYCFIDDAALVPGIVGQKNTAVQLFLKKGGQLPDLPVGEIILAVALGDTEHLDWAPIIAAGKNAAGFMLIDDRGRYIHRFFDFLNAVGDGFSGAVHYCGATNDADNLDDAYRLVQKIRPNLISGLRLFAGADFFRNLDIGGKIL